MNGPDSGTERIGKRVQGALYLHRSALGSLTEGDRARVAAAERLAGAPAWNVIKLEERAPRRTTLLLYEDLDAVAFPALLEATTVDLGRSRVARRDFHGSANPPILHRKELLLPPDHRDRARYTALTAALEAAGLFVDAARIGFRRTWEAKLAAAGIAVVDHALVTLDAVPGTVPGPAPPTPPAGVERHRTAITRDRLSAPVQALVRHGLVTAETTVLDYGCGLGDDVRALQAGGVRAAGWDPYHAPGTPLEPADVVNLGYVLNVIEDPEERRAALRRAYGLARACLAVAVLIVGKTDTTGHQPYRDGVLTSRGTFQKYYRQEEAKAFVEEELGREAVAAAGGVFLVFKDELLEQRFLLDRQCRRLAPVQAFRPPPRERPDAGALRAEVLGPLLEPLWQRILELGREPVPEDLDPALLDALRRDQGSLPRALRRCRDLFDRGELAAARAARRDDLLVYFALNQFGGGNRYRAFPPELQRDVRAHFGSLAEATAAARELLFSAGRPDVIRAACEKAYDDGLGWLDEEGALLLAAALVERLPPVLRCYAGCAARLYGDVTLADMVKIHSRSGKLTLLFYDGFADRPLPVLRERVKIDLRHRRVDVFDHAKERQLLLLKSRYTAPELPSHADQAGFDAALARLGLAEAEGYGPSAERFEMLLRAKGHRVEGFNILPTLAQ